MAEPRPNRQVRDAALEKLYQEEFSALQRAELALTKQQLSTAVYEPFRDLVRHYRRLLRQSVKITAVSDATQLQLRQTSRELAEAATHVQQLNAELVDLQEEKDEIFAMAVHDMKSPLSGIYGMASLMVDGTINDPAECTEVGQDIRLLSEKMLLMINDLVEIYRLESGEVDFQPIEIAPVDLVSLLTAAHRPTARRKHINLQFNHHSDVGSIIVDPPAVERLGGNLISNALKYSPPGTTVTVDLNIAKGQLDLTVTDEGPGISASDQKKLFRKFSRLSARPTGNESSSGLGLAIVKQLVEALQGRVTCESTLGAGAAFRITLPVSAGTV